MSRSAFSLVELSIVLVILGLLTGGILTGQNLIRAAELRSVVTEFRNNQTAVHTFRDQYLHLPGDMKNATDFWGAATCPTAAGTGTDTCNGDGDGEVEFPASGGQFGEVYTFWQHLANAGLREGTYTGMAGSGGTNNAIIGQNIPASKLSNGGWISWAIEDQSSDSLFFDGSYGNSFQIGAAIGTFTPYGALFTPEEAWNIDTKLDDGKASRGKMVIRLWDTCTDAANGADLDASYLLSSSSKACSIIFRNAY